MIFFPAIDLKDGNCVRLLRGAMDQATVFSKDPGAQARAFQDQGCKWLHVVDLNGAFAGEPVNAAAVEAVLAALSIPMQLGGGIRTLETIEFWLGAGVRRVILGTIAVRDPALVIEACKRFPGQVALGIDARDGLVAVEGWGEVSEMTVLELAMRFEDAGAAAIIHTDISRDGAMEGPNLDATMELAGSVSVPVIVSGGVSSMSDIRNIVALSSVQPGRLEGVISGRAVYDGQVGVAEATALLGAA
jgi:phosphoribosylformimino-5-aminoimidazole carboxamide ribotide isomerase